MQVQLEVFLEIVFTLYLFLKFSTIAFLNPSVLSHSQIPSVALLSFSSIQFSRCTSVQECTLKIEQRKKLVRKGLTLDSTRLSSRMVSLERR